MSLLLTITGLTLGFIVVCRTLLVGVRAVARPALAEESAPKPRELKVSPVRR